MSVFSTGHARNIYFPFDIVNDTAMDVAVEMVKELEISDWEPSEIAVMIEKEISSLVPSYDNWSSPQDYHSDQHCYSYEDDDDCDGDVVRHPFHSFSSCSSSQSSLPVFGFPSLVQCHSAKNMTKDQDWFHGMFKFSDIIDHVHSLVFYLKLNLIWSDLVNL